MADTSATHAPAPHTPGRFGQFCREYLPMLLVAAVLVAAAVLVWQDHWRRGAYVIGAAVVGAAVLRMGLPPERVGLLAVRSRGFDVAAYCSLGLAIILTAATINSLGVV